MKKYLLGLFLLLSGCLYSQTYKADSLVYYSSAYNLTPDTIISEEITIMIFNGQLSITKHNARFNAFITDTLNSEKAEKGIVDRLFKLRTYPTMYKDDTGYVLLMIMSYWNDNLIALGLLHNEQLFIYHIVSELINLNSSIIWRKQNDILSLK